MEQIICAREGCFNIVKQTSKYTKRKYCTENNNYCRDFANNTKHQELRKVARQQGLVKKKYVGGKIKMGNENEHIDYYMPTDLQKELNIINAIENKLQHNYIKAKPPIKKETLVVSYNKPTKPIVKKQKQLFDYIFDKWIFYKPSQHKIKKIITISTMQLCLF